MRIIHIHLLFSLVIYVHVWCLFRLLLSFRLDGKHVVFGKVVAGSDVVSAIEQVGSESGSTRVPVVVADCGQLR